MLILSGLTFSNLAASVETLQGGGEAIQSPSVLNLVLFRGGKRKRGIEKNKGIEEISSGNQEILDKEKWSPALKKKCRRV